MKSIVVLLLLLLVCVSSPGAGNSATSVSGSSETNSQRFLPDTLLAKIDKAIQRPESPGIRHLSIGQDLLVLMPVILLLFFLALSLAILRRTGFDLGEALKENEPAQKLIPNPNAHLKGAAPTLSISDDKYPLSSSRLLAFLTSIVAVLLVISATTYSFYFGLKFGQMPDLGGLQTFALSLGVGVVPYAFNRIAHAFR